MKLIVMQGLPASGKSTRSKEIINNSQENTVVRINRDLLREMLHFGKYSDLNEREVMNSSKLLAEYFLRFGFDVIIDDTNLKPKNINLWRDVAELVGADIVIIALTTSLEECIKRDASREKSVGEEVIRGMIDHNLKVDSH